MKKLISVVSSILVISTTVVSLSPTAVRALTNPMPSKVWISIFANISDAYSLVFSMDIDSDENIYITGASTGAWETPLHDHSGSAEDIFVAKFDKDRNLIWNTFLGGIGNERGEGITINEDGSIYIAGNGINPWELQDTLTPLAYPVGGVPTAFVAKLGSNGEPLWYTFPIGGESYANAIEVDAAGNIIVGGTIDDSDGAFVMKLDPDGTHQWMETFGSRGGELVLDSSGNIFLVGDSIFASSDYDIFVTKLDNNGTQQWNTLLGGNGDDLGYTLALDDDGNIYAGGRSYANWGTPIRSYRGSDDAVVAKLDAHGSLLWHTFLGNSQSDEGWDIALDHGVVYFCGVSASTWGTPVWNHSGGEDAFLAGIDENGALLWNGFIGKGGETSCLASIGLGNEFVYIGGSIGTTITESAFIAKIGPQPTGAFSKVSPADEAALQPINLNLNWKSSSGATYYTYCYDTINNNLCDSAWQDAGNSTSAALNALDSGQTYYWQVRAGNAVGMTSSNQNTWWKFSTILDQPMLISPADDQQLFALRATFDWENVDNATNYVLQISRDGNFSNILKSVTVVAPTYTLDRNLPRNSTLHWRVRAKNAKGASPWSEARSFVTGNPPSVSTLVSPAQGALTKDYTPTFNWSDSSVPADTTFKQYEIQVDNDKDFSSVSISAYIPPNPNPTSQYTHDADLDPNTKYYWRVRAISTFNGNDQFSAWSPIGNFRSALAPPLLLSPADLNTGISTKPMFSWQAVAGASGYTIQASTASSFSTLKINVTTNDATYTPAANLPANKQIYWRVRANGLNGPGSWSEVWTFNQPTLAVPTIVSPSNGTSLRVPVVLQWNAVTLAAKYQVRYVQPGSNTYVTQPEQTELTFTLYQPDDWLWQVRAGDALGNWSDWSTPYSLEALGGAFSATPQITSPASETVIDTLRPQIKWSIPLHVGGWMYGNDQYRIQFDNNNDFSSPEYDKAQNSYSLEGSLPNLIGVYTLVQKDWLPSLGDQMDIPPDGTYYIRVRGETTDGLASEWSTPITLDLQLSYDACSPATDGPKIYNLSWGPFTENYPKMMGLSVDDQLPEGNQTIAFSIDMVVEPYHTQPSPELDPITNVLLYVYTDHQISDPIPLTLTSGTGINGTWQGQWTADDTFCFRYRYIIEATNAAVTLPFDLVVRDGD